MIEPIMFFGLGFLISSLIGLAIAPLVHARAVRLTRRRMEASAPMSLVELQADKDQLRAEFAVTIRRLETTIEQLNEKTVTQLAEVGKKTAEIAQLRAELGQKSQVAGSLETREKSLADQLDTSQRELLEKNARLVEAERKLVEKETELARISQELSERGLVADSQRIELVALRTQVGTLRDQVNGHAEEAKHAEALRRKSAEAALATDGRIESPPTAAQNGDTEGDAILRERLTQIAAEMVRLTQVLEGPDSPVEKILATPSPLPQGSAAANGSASPVLGGDGQLTLADRIRALQTRPAVPVGQGGA